MSPRLLLAPMAGYTDRTFRSLCRSFGCDLCYTEMVSAKGLYYSSVKTNDLLRLSSDEGAVSIQLFGSEADILANITRRLCDEFGNRIESIDLNLGCPAPKITSNGDGSALLKDPLLIARLLTAMVKVSSLPITCKIRTGWDENSINYLEVGRIAQESGVSSITLHGRTRAQQYGGRADWQSIARLKSELCIPVVGNGDVRNATDALELLNKTACDGIMIGRGALGRPWVFKEIRSAINGEQYKPPSELEIRHFAIEHARLVIADKGEHGIVELRKHLPFYLQGTKGSAALRQSINRVGGLAELESILLGQA